MSFEGLRQGAEVLGEHVLEILENKFFALAATYVEKYRGEKDPYSKAIKEFVDDYFDALNIHPQFIAEGRPGFREMREHLRSDAGIVLLNHPNEYLDIPSVATALAIRDDVKIMVKQQLVARLTNAFGRQFIVPSYKGGRELVGARDEVVEHIESGGVFLIFPSGQVTSKFRFEGFVKQLLKSKEIKDTDMVYSFYINQEDAEACSPDLRDRLVGMSPGLLLRSKIQSPSIHEPRIVRVDEHYAQVGEYRRLVAGLRGDEAGAALSKHYFEQFGIEQP
ncbi:MAG TPA: 1-acyl-sn-glycerol-3-phosphate acyltransferase [Candidatus Paceibacterota bacterium]